MRRILTTLALAALLSAVFLSNAVRAGCPAHGNACAPKHQKCEPPQWCKNCFARWDARREKCDINKCISKCYKTPTTCSSNDYAKPVVSSWQTGPSGQAY
jgi:hypothetical protein